MITQEEIARFKELQSRADLIHEQLDPLKESLIVRLVARARIASGKHKIFLQVRERRNVAWKEKAMNFAKKMGLDPEKWAKRMVALAKKQKSHDLKAT